MVEGKTISLCTFVLNEEKALGGMIESVLDIVDEINVVIDNRTVDRTEEVARKYTNRIKYVEFVDFSQMRNTALRMATKDYILMLDADERLLKDELWCLEELVKRPQCEVWYLARRHYADLEMKTELPSNPPYPDWQCRFLKNLPHIHYIRPVHEIINGTQKRGYSHKPTIRHFHAYFKTKEEQEERQKLYARIIKQDTKYKY